MFQNGWLMPGFEYLVLTFLVSILTGFMCYISLRKNGRMTKKYYVICSITILPLLAFWAIMGTASFAYFQDRLIVYAAVGGIGLLFLLSDLWFRNNMFYTFLFSFMAAFIQFSVSMAFEILRESFAWELKMLTGTLVCFYMSLFFSVLFLLLTYLPRREKKRRDKAAVIVPLASILLIGCGVVLNFLELLSGTALWVSDIAVCLLTIASWFLLLSTGMEPVNTTSEAGTRV